MKVMKQISKQYDSLYCRDNLKIGQGYVDLKNKTTEELNELIERQNKLLRNRFFLDKLPDKGKKILLFKAELESELQKRQENYDAACQLFINLNLNDSKTEEIEWNKGNLNAFKKQNDKDTDMSVEKESQKEMEDPLKLLATHSGTINGRNKKNFFHDSKSCNGELKNNEALLYVEKFCEKYGTLNTSKERFKPNQLKNNDKTLFVTSAEKVKKRLGDNWEITQATPPIPSFKDTVLISLQESLKLQTEQAKNLLKIEKAYATEKLSRNIFVKIGDKLPLNNVTEYRNAKTSFEEALKDEDDSNSSESESD